MKKNIWVINQYSGTPDYGMNYRSYYLSRELLKHGYSTTIFSGSFSHLFRRYPETRGRYTVESIRDVRFVWVKLRRYKGSRSLGRLISMFEFMFKLFFFNINRLEKPDVIIISSLSILPVINAYIWSKKFKSEFIFEVRDIWPLTLVELGNFSRYHPLVIFLGLIEKFGYRKAAKVVSVLPEASGYMKSRGMSDEKFRYIPNGIDLEEVKNPEVLERNVLNIVPKGKFIVGYAGTTGISNALQYFVEAADRLRGLKNIHFIIVGDGKERDHIVNIVAERNLKNVTLIDAVAKRRVQSVLSLFDVCYIGWYKKGIYKNGISANKIFEYMYASKPIIHSYSGNGDLIKMAKCGISVEAENSEKIANAIYSLYKTDQKKLIEMGGRGRLYVLNNHLYSELGKRYANVIEETGLISE